jgi:hypothetical protein
VKNRGTYPNFEANSDQSGMSRAYNIHVLVSYTTRESIKSSFARIETIFGFLMCPCVNIKDSVFILLFH